MAPKGGGKGGSSGSSRGSSSACSACTSPLELLGSDWKNPFVLGAFAVDIIVALVLVACIILQTRFKWVREGVALDKLRNKGFYYAAGSLFITYILYLVDIALNEEEHVTTNLYYLMYIVADLFARIADILILAIIFRCIAESSPANLARKLAKLHKFFIILLAFLSVCNFALYTTQIAYAISESYVNMAVNKTYECVSVAYAGIYLIAALLAGVESLKIFLRLRSKQSTLLIALIAPSLILHCIFVVIAACLRMYYTNWSLLRRRQYRDLRMAATFIPDITNIGIYLGVVLVGWLEFRPGGGNRGKYAYAEGVGGRI